MHLPRLTPTLEISRLLGILHGFCFVFQKRAHLHNSLYAVVNLTSAELQLVGMSGALVWEESYPAAKGMEQAEDWEGLNCGLVFWFFCCPAAVSKRGPQNDCGLRDSSKNGEMSLPKLATTSEGQVVT